MLLCLEITAVDYWQKITNYQEQKRAKKKEFITM
jgi:hypothetical protein